MSNVHLRQLSVTLGGKRVIEGLDLAIHDGEFLVLLGPSGCGKSTLLHSIAGLNDVSGGSIEIGGVDMVGVDPSQRGIGMVFQSYALYPTMTVAKNMSFGLRVAGLPKADIARRVARAAAMLHLEDLLDRKPAQLSGGQRQRVAIGRALVREASVFLFDEPLSNLDAKLRAELRRELKLLHQTLGSTMVYVTHDQVEALTLATRIVVMDGGKVQQIGTPGDVYDNPANLFVAGFLGAPAMNVVGGEIDGRGCFRAGAFTVPVAGTVAGAAAATSQPAILGVRPEHIHIDDLPGSARLQGTVALVEPMGNHQIVWIRCGEQLLSAIVQDARGFAANEAVSFGIDATRARLFDPQDGKALSLHAHQLHAVR